MITENILGFRNERIDIFLKVGGSILKNPGRCKEIIEEIVLASQLTGRQKIVLFPGGGPPDKAIEKINSTISIPAYVHHKACALAQDQCGMIISSYHTSIIPTASLIEVNNILKEGKIPLILPSVLLCHLDVFEHDWIITSDTIGAYFAWILRANKYVILTDVDGIYSYYDSSEAELITSIPASELCKMGETSVDQCLAPFLQYSKLETFVINGLIKDLIKSFIGGEEVRCTQITS